MKNFAITCYKQQGALKGESSSLIRFAVAPYSRTIVNAFIIDFTRIIVSTLGWWSTIGLQIGRRRQSPVWRG
jgi:hypothetical protein